MLPVVHCLKIVVSKILYRLWKKNESNPYYAHMAENGSPGCLFLIWIKALYWLMRH